MTCLQINFNSPLCDLAVLVHTHIYFSCIPTWALTQQALGYEWSTHSPLPTAVLTSLAPVPAATTAAVAAGTQGCF